MNYISINFHVDGSSHFHQGELKNTQEDRQVQLKASSQEKNSIPYKIMP